MRVALIGANGHGHWHRRELARRPELELVGLCDLAPISDIDGAPVPPGVVLTRDYRDLLARTRPDIAIVCTPPHTHVELAGAALRAGCDVLLEKPPVPSLARQRELQAVIEQTGRSCQVGFQALGSAALARLLEAIRDGVLGRVTGIAAIAAWQRPDAYYARAPWAGWRQAGGEPVIDGALVNPLAHAVMQALAVAAVATGTSKSSTVELERYRTRPIEVEDTGFLRARTASGLPVLVAVTLCGEQFIAGEIIVTGSAGRAVLEYPTDRLALPGQDELRPVPGRQSLLDNLVAHRLDRAQPLIVPLARTEPFTVLLEAIVASPEPTPLASDLIEVDGCGPQRQHTIPGINDVLRACARELALPHELGVPWARREQLTKVHL